MTGEVSGSGVISPRHAGRNDPRSEDRTPAVVLTIAGSDSGGGAGIQADLATFAAHRVHGCTAITALTAQNTVEVRGILPTPPEFLRAQIEAVLDDLPVAAVKTGMLATAANVEAVADFASAGRLPNLVVDPVMVSSTGARLLDDVAVRAYVELLLPSATVFTPNCREAAVLLAWDEPITTVERQREAAEALQQRATNRGVVIVTGGDVADPAGGDPADDQPSTSVADGPEVVDVECGPGYLTVHRSPRIHTRNNHGTGCSLASAIAAQLASGSTVSDAIDEARAFVGEGLSSAALWHLGAGHGPIDHFTPHPDL